MSLEDLTEDVEATYRDLGDTCTTSLDRETRTELAMLETVLEPEETDELVRRAIHLLFQSTVETGRLDFHLRSGYDVTYDEYLTGMTFQEMAGGQTYPKLDDERRYRF
ncbi:hypothetical protein [Natronobiforma cellulositropha]|uniref:hypothetical protein n=1 Tax=Natronobiforma cellulositropha TaxID=1679076 RepID=UPI0021D5C515|nr:hypothetical protein [Natronobiforma cellulositropha]